MGKQHAIPRQEIMTAYNTWSFVVKILGCNLYVTDVSWIPKTWAAHPGKMPYRFGSLATAMDFVFALAVNGHCAVVEVVPNWIPEENMKEIYTNPKKEDV